MAITIDKDAPLPTGAYAKNKYPFAEMVKGDSFFVEGGKRNTIASIASGFKRRHPGFDFTVKEVHIVAGDVVTDVRVWSTSNPEKAE